MAGNDPLTPEVARRDDLTAKAREIAAALNDREARRLGSIVGGELAHVHPGDPVNIRLIDLGVLYVREAIDPWPLKHLSYCQATDLGRVVDAVLTEKECNRAP